MHGRAHTRAPGLRPPPRLTLVLRRAGPSGGHRRGLHVRLRRVFLGVGLPIWLFALLVRCAHTRACTRVRCHSSLARSLARRAQDGRPVPGVGEDDDAVATAVHRHNRRRRREAASSRADAASSPCARREAAAAGAAQPWSTGDFRCVRVRLTRVRMRVLAPCANGHTQWRDSASAPGASAASERV